jgi:galactofuranose transport system ATP-binding protein
MADGPFLLMQGVTKTYPGVRALDVVDFDVERGEVHALVGENGAGKSTLLKILTGAIRRDAGRILLNGRAEDFRSPREAQAHGVVAVHQEVQLLWRRTVAENILAGREPMRWGLIDWSRLNEIARAVLDRLGLGLEPTTPVGGLNVALRQMVAVARAASLGARIVVLDEPTSSLTGREVALLFDVIHRLRAESVSIVYVSHRFDELYALCDRVTVLRDGRLVCTRPLAGLDRRDLVCLMLGKHLEDFHAETRAPRCEMPPETPPLLRGENLKRGVRPDDVTVEVRHGEVVGLAGLLGSGRTETARLLFGLDPLEGGEVWLEGRQLQLHGPSDAIRAGMGFLAEDRKEEGIIPDLSVAENLTLAALPGLTRLGVVSRARQRALVARFMARLRIKAVSPRQKIRELSGGNQQKVLLARWLCRNPRLLILDEPTRGIDLGARAEIEALIAELAEGGLGVLLIASDLEELLGISSRVIVLRDGRVTAQLGGQEMSERRIVQAMAGGGKA